MPTNIERMNEATGSIPSEILTSSMYPAKWLSAPIMNALLQVPHEAETRIAVVAVRREPKARAVGTSGNGAITVPTATSIDAVCARVWPLRVCAASQRRLPVQAIFPYVPVRVVQPPRIRTVGAGKRCAILRSAIRIDHSNVLDVVLVPSQHVQLRVG